ncbi:MAG: hypothetical protein ACRBCJ_06455 [Hyphomicrobiaceae bacterium]
MSNQAPGIGLLEMKDKMSMQIFKRGQDRNAVSGTAKGLLMACMLGAGIVAVPVAAFAVTEKVERNCKRDYKRFCSKYSIGTTSLRKCMESNGRRLSRKCKRALVDAGQVPRRYLRKKRRR